MKIALSVAHTAKSPGAARTVKWRGPGHSLVAQRFEEHALSAHLTRVAARYLRGLPGPVDSRVFNDKGRLSLPEKTRAINEWGADLAVEVHFNAVTPGGRCGPLCLHYPGSELGKLSAKVIHDALARELGPGYEPMGVLVAPGDRYKRDLWFLRKTRCPSVIVEPLALDQPAAQAFLAGPESVASLAYAISEALLHIAHGQCSRSSSGSPR